MGAFKILDRITISEFNGNMRNLVISRKGTNEYSIAQQSVVQDHPNKRPQQYFLNPAIEVTPDKLIEFRDALDRVIKSENITLSAE